MSAPAAKNSPTLAVGGRAPDFTLQTDNEGDISLAKLKGKNVVLYFYPRDDTPGCTIEAKDFRDRMEQFKAANTVIIGVSRDSVESHEKFRKKFCLPFTLGSDESGKTCEDYGVWVEKSMYGRTYMGIERTTFLIDAKGVIRKIWRKVKVPGHSEDVLNALKELKA